MVGGKEERKGERETRRKWGGKRELKEKRNKKEGRKEEHSEERNILTVSSILVFTSALKWLTRQEAKQEVRTYKAGHPQE